MAHSKSFLNGRVQVKVGDITREQVDAIVNAANGTLMGGGGVDGAIHRAGGPQILQACKEIRRLHWPEGLPTGRAVLTCAGKMPAKYVIHTVGPVYGRGGADKAQLLAACYRNSLSLAIEHGLKSVAFPAISTGYSYNDEETLAAAQPKLIIHNLSELLGRLSEQNMWTAAADHNGMALESRA